MLPSPRTMNEPPTVGAGKGEVVDLDPMLDEYYKLRGWDNAGVPTADTLARLAMSEPNS